MLDKLIFLLHMTLGVERSQILELQPCSVRSIRRSLGILI